MTDEIESKLLEGCGKKGRYKYGNHYEICGEDEWLCNECELKLEQHRQTKKWILELIDKFENFYPKDIFLWDNKLKLDFDRGRFNRHCFEIVENVKSELKRQILG
jgi:hypothetical protein